VKVVTGGGTIRTHPMSLRPSSGADKARETSARETSPPVTLDVHADVHNTTDVFRAPRHKTLHNLTLVCHLSTYALPL